MQINESILERKILMRIIKLPCYHNYWSQTIRYLAIADVVSRNHFETISRYFHFVFESDHDVNDKLFKVRSMLDAVPNDCIKIEPKEYHSIDKQIIPSQAQFTRICQYNQKIVKWLEIVLSSFDPILWVLNEWKQLSNGKRKSRSERRFHVYKL